MDKRRTLLAAAQYVILPILSIAGTALVWNADTQQDFSKAERGAVLLAIGITVLNGLAYYGRKREMVLLTGSMMLAMFHVCTTLALCQRSSKKAGLLFGYNLSAAAMSCSTLIAAMSDAEWLKLSDQEYTNSIRNQMRARQEQEEEDKARESNSRADLHSLRHTSGISATQLQEMEAQRPSPPAPTRDRDLPRIGWNKKWSASQYVAFFGAGMMIPTSLIVGLNWSQLSLYNVQPCFVALFALLGIGCEIEWVVDLAVHMAALVFCPSMWEAFSASQDGNTLVLFCSFFLVGAILVLTVAHAVNRGGLPVQSELKMRIRRKRTIVLGIGWLCWVVGGFIFAVSDGIKGNKALKAYGSQSIYTIGISLGFFTLSTLAKNRIACQLGYFLLFGVIPPLTLSPIEYHAKETDDCILVSDLNGTIDWISPGGYFEGHTFARLLLGAAVSCCLFMAVVFNLREPTPDPPRRRRGLSSGQGSRSGSDNAIMSSVPTPRTEDEEEDDDPEPSNELWLVDLPKWRLMVICLISAMGFIGTILLTWGAGSPRFLSLASGVCVFFAACIVNNPVLITASMYIPCYFLPYIVVLAMAPNDEGGVIDSGYTMVLVSYLFIVPYVCGRFLLWGEIQVSTPATAALMDRQLLTSRRNAEEVWEYGADGTTEPGTARSDVDWNESTSYHAVGDSEL